MKAKKILLVVLSLVLVFSALAIITGASTANGDAQNTPAGLSEVEGEYVEGYGVIPEAYANATAYPIVIFQNGEFKAAFAKDEFNKALEYPRTNLGLRNETDPAPAKILLRGDATVTTEDQNLGQTAGTIDVNLNGFTLTHTHSSYLFYGIAKTVNNFAQKFTLNVYNGNIVLGSQFLYIAAQNSGNTGPLKDMELNFTNLNISLSGVMGSNTWFVVSGNGTVSGTNDTLAQYDVRMNDCVLDLSKLNKANQIFQLSAANANIDFEINGGKLIAGPGGGNGGTQPWRTALYTLGASNSAISFNKGSDGKYLTIVAHTDINSYISKGYATILDNRAFSTKSGATAKFINPVTNGDWVTYTLQADEYVDGYGTIPLTYADFDTHPIVLFQDGKFVGGYTKTQFATALGAAKDCVTKAGAPAAKLLLRGDAEFAGTSNADNLGQALSEIDINLGGYSLTHTSGTFVFYLRMKSHTVNGETFIFNIRNGNLVIVGNGVLFAVGAQANDASVKLTDVNINMTNVNLVHKNTGYNSGPIFYNQSGDNSSADKEIKYTLTMTDCTLDFSNMGKANTIFDTTSSHVSTSNGVVTKAHAFDIKINGGELIAGKGSGSGLAPYASTLYTLNDYSSISFGKGSDGNSFKITVPKDVTASILNAEAQTDTGVECVFVKVSANETTTTYKLYPKVMVDYKIKTSITLYSNFVYNIYVPTANVNSFTVNGKTVDYTTETIDGVEYYVVKVDLPAGETLADVKLCVTLNSGNTTVDANWTLNVYNYTKSVLAGNYDDTTKTLMKDMLVYASAAHTYFENTEAVAAKLSEIKTLLGDYAAEMPIGEAKAPADKTYFTDVAVYLGEVPSFRFYLASGYTAADFSFKVGNRAATVVEGEGYVEIVMYAYMMLDDVTFTVKTTGATGTYNLYSYYEYAKTLNNANLTAVVEALMKYSVSAKAYRDSVVNK